jgi:hypothetical protein
VKPSLGFESDLAELNPSGTSWKTDNFFRTTQKHKIQRTDYSENWHTFGLEWDKDYLYTWVDNRLQQVLYVDFKKQDLWQRGHFQGEYENSTQLTNPWFNGGKNAPFDQKFYLILNVAVGSRNGWFRYVFGSLARFCVSPSLTHVIQGRSWSQAMG